MSQGEIFDAAARFRRELLRQERAASTEMVRQYGEIWKRIKAAIDELTAKYYEAEAAGLEMSPAWLFQFERLQSLQRQVEAELQVFAASAERAITAQQWQAVQAAERHAQELMTEALGERASLEVSFTRLNREALYDLVGFTQKGSPLFDLLAELGPAASEAVKQGLIGGLALGLSPREVASQIRKALGGNLARALTIARTETLRSYREATRRAYQANTDVVKGWIWMCGKDGRTCAACWAMHGTFHTMEERLDDHPNGRCAMVPVTKTWEELGLPGVPEAEAPVAEKGVDLFAQLPEAEQRSILGPAKFQAYQAGDLKLEDLVGRKRNKEWGSMRHELSLQDVLGVEAARKYRSLARQPSG